MTRWRGGLGMSICPPFVWRCPSGAVMFSTPMPTKHVVRVMSACRPIGASTDAVSNGSNTSTPAVGVLGSEYAHWPDPYRRNRPGKIGFGRRTCRSKRIMNTTFRPAGRRVDRAAHFGCGGCRVSPRGAFTRSSCRAVARLATGGRIAHKKSGRSPCHPRGRKDSLRSTARVAPQEPNKALGLLGRR